jgi:hypothetical protein
VWVILLSLEAGAAVLLQQGVLNPIAVAVAMIR